MNECFVMGLAIGLLAGMIISMIITMSHTEYDPENDRLFLGLRIKASPTEKDED